MIPLFKKIYGQFSLRQDMSCDQTSIQGNGNIILGLLIPDEILLQIFENLDDDILVKIIPLVCRHWHELAKSSHLWRKRLKKHSIKISKKRFEKLFSMWNSDPKVIKTVQWLCINCDRKVINHNLLKNPSGEQNFEHWKVHHGGDHIIVEEPPIGCDPIPEEAGLPTQHCFASSYDLSKRSQSVSLCRDCGLKPFVLEVLQPSLVISEWVSSRFDCGGQSMIQVTVIGKNDVNPIFTTRWKDSDYGRIEWHKVWKKVKYEELPKDMHTIQFKNLSQDSQFWAGHYGPKTAGSSLVLDISTD